MNTTLAENTSAAEGMGAEDTQAGRVPFPRTVYLALWFPLSSETFVFYEVEALWKQGLPVSVVSLYGYRQRNLASHMRQSPIPVLRLGMAALPRLLGAVWRRWRREPARTMQVLRHIFWRRWRDAEMRLESAWAGVCGFYLAEHCREAGVQHLHAAWGNGPATAAWVVNALEGIPYSFTARAGDVRPPDGFLREKLEACAFARADSSFNMPHMASFLPPAQHSKLHLVYNVCTLPSVEQATVRMHAPFKVLAIGRLVETKGFQYLLDATRLLLDQGVQVQVTIAGSGMYMLALQRRITSLGLDKHVHMAGFVTHDNISRLILDSDMLVMPSVVRRNSDDSDGLPTVVVEAMCHGLPVVGTDVASMGDVVVDGETGFLVPERDAPRLAAAMRKLMDDRDNALRMATNARERVARMFDSKANLARMRDLIREYTPVQTGGQTGGQGAAPTSSPTSSQTVAGTEPRA